MKSTNIQNRLKMSKISNSNQSGHHININNNDNSRIYDK
jgi:hypothetical protein